MNDDREHKVRERAYALWEDEGRPAGRHAEHWQRASSEIAQDASSQPQGEPEAPEGLAPVKAKASRRKPVAASPSSADAPAAVGESAAAPRKRRALKPKAS